MSFSKLPWRVEKDGDTTNKRYTIFSAENRKLGFLSAGRIAIQDDIRLVQNIGAIMKEMHFLCEKYGDRQDQKRVLGLMSRIRGQVITPNEKAGRIGLGDMW